MAFTQYGKTVCLDYKQKSFWCLKTVKDTSCALGPQLEKKDTSPNVFNFDNE